MSEQTSRVSVRQKRATDLAHAALNVLNQDPWIVEVRTPRSPSGRTALTFSDLAHLTASLTEAFLEVLP